MAGGTGSSHHQQKKQSVPDGERPAVHIAIVCGLLAGCVLRGAPFLFEKISGRLQPFVLPQRI